MLLRHDIEPHKSAAVFVGENSEYPRALFPLHRNPHVEFGLESVPKGSGIPRHRHADQSEILYVHRGCMQVFMSETPSDDDSSTTSISGEQQQEKMLLVCANQAVLIPRGHWHRALNVTGTELDPSYGAENSENHIVNGENNSMADDSTLWITWTLMRDQVDAVAEAKAVSAVESAPLLTQMGLKN